MQRAAARQASHRKNHRPVGGYDAAPTHHRVGPLAYATFLHALLFVALLRLNQALRRVTPHARLLLKYVYQAKRDQFRHPRDRPAQLVACPVCDSARTGHADSRRCTCGDEVEQTRDFVADGGESEEIRAKKRLYRSPANSCFSSGQASYFRFFEVSAL